MIHDAIAAKLEIWVAWVYRALVASVLESVVFF
jgi:hypothetical protein